MRSLLILTLLAFAAAQAHAAQRLVLFGGGSFPREAVDRYMEAAGGKDARLLMITWASGTPEEYVREFVDSVAPWKPALEISPSTAAIAGREEEFLAQLARARGVFFIGGDQKRIADVFARIPALRAALRERYRAGVPFGGTSAGTAVMSERMITGEGDFEVIDGEKVEVGRGLGLLPEDVVVDQHFLVRRRQNRLFGVVLKHPGSLGIGVDEPCALVVDDGRYAQAFGPTPLLAAFAEGPARLRVELLKSGERYDLKARKKLQP